MGIFDETEGTGNVGNGTEFGDGFKPLTELESYYPTRLEYLAGKALQGMCVGRAEKFLRNVPRLSLELAQDMERLLEEHSEKSG